MSVILEALKKLDREKSSRRSRTANIAVEILRSDLPRPRKRILLYFAAVSLATATITYAVIVEFGFFSKSSPPAPVKPPVPSQQVAPSPPQPGSPPKSLSSRPVNPPAQSQQVAPAPLSREPVREGQHDASRVPPKVQTPVKGQPSGESKASAKREAPAESRTPATSLDEEEEEEEEVDVAPRKIGKTAEPAPKKSATTSPSLRVSGIVWREEPSERLAVINGMILREGGEIEGAKVEEIHSNRVRFSYKDRPFEISLGSSLVISE